MKKFVMYFYNLKHEMYKKVEREYNPKTDKEGIEHFCGGYARSVIISVEKSPKHIQRTKKRKRVLFDNEEILF